MSVRTRVAPSPTGAPHVGTAYIALFNYCFARANQGRFILRVEDTDRNRCHPHYEREIMNALRWLNIDWDSGPDKPDSQFNYRQSGRESVYGEYVQQLLNAGKAFYCFATAEELDEMRAAQRKKGETARYDGRGLALSQTEIDKNLKAGKPHVVRMKVPEKGKCEFQDTLRGKVSIPWEQVDMQVILKADGSPTYHLASVVDDHLMDISHVIRGEEWINSTPKHLLLYEYLGWTPPEWCHMPLLRNPDGTKLSKRRNPTNLLYYRKAGYLPEAMCNYLGRMGWSMPNDAEIFTVKEMIESFDLKRISLGAPTFDVQKLDWLNGEWMRAMDSEQLARRVREWLPEQQRFQDFLTTAVKRVQTMGDLPTLGGFLLQKDLGLQAADFDGLPLEKAQVKDVLQLALWRCTDLATDWQHDTIFPAFKELATELDVPVKKFMAPIFIAICGSTESIAVSDALVLLGVDMSIHRLQSALNVVGYPSKKQTESLRKRYDKLMHN